MRGCWSGTAYARSRMAEMLRQPPLPRTVYVPPRPPKVTRVGRRVRLRWEGADVAHEYSNDYQAKRMALVLAKSSAARRRFMSTWGEL